MRAAVCRADDRPMPHRTCAPASARPLEPTGLELRELLHAAIEHVVELVDRLPTAAVLDNGGVADLLADPTVRRPPPEHGRDVDDLLAVLDRAAAKGINSASGGALAYVPGSGLVSAAVADLLAGVLNRYTGLAAPAPGLVALETDVLRWFADLFGLPAGAAGTLTTGASLATLSAVVTARTAMLPEDFRAGTLYVTSQSHHCVTKAARLAGFPATAVRIVPTDARLRMDPVALRRAIGADRTAGLHPFCVVATAGTTNTGTVDPLPAIADVATSERLWLHVDAAYGGFFQLTDRGRARLRGIERADSLVLDPHKSLFLPFGTGCLLVRDGRLLAAAHDGGDAPYLQDLEAGALPDFAAYGPELTREFRGLRLWLPLHLHGVAAFRAALDEKLDLAAHAHAELSRVPALAVLAPPDLSTVAFRCRAGDAATTALLGRVNAEGRVLLSSTRVDGQVLGRICVLNHRTDRARVDEALDTLRRHAG
jgi:aromatic-L-amino-acid/L-tryptophan decarboxylase